MRGSCEEPLVLSTTSSLRTTIRRQSQASRIINQNIMHADTIVTKPPDAVRILASSTVFWKASNVRNRPFPIGEKCVDLAGRVKGTDTMRDWQAKFTWLLGYLQINSSKSMQTDSNLQD